MLTRLVPFRPGPLLGLDLIVQANKAPSALAALRQLATPRGSCVHRTSIVLSILLAIMLRNESTRTARSFHATEEANTMLCSLPICSLSFLRSILPSSHMLAHRSVSVTEQNKAGKGRQGKRGKGGTY